MKNQYKILSFQTYSLEILQDLIILMQWKPQDSLDDIYFLSSSIKQQLNVDFMLTWP